MPFNFMPERDPNPYRHTEGAIPRLVASMIGIQERKNAQARQAELDRIAEEERQRRIKQEEEDRALKFAEVAQRVAAMQERPKEKVADVPLPVGAPLSPQQQADFGEPNAVESAQEVATQAAQPVLPVEMPTPTPTLPISMGGQQLDVPLYSRSETLARADEDFKRKLEQEKQLYEARDVDVTIPDDPKYGALAGLTVPKTVAAVVLRGNARGPENPEPVVIDGKPTMATPTEIADAKTRGATVAPYQAPSQRQPPEPGQLSPQRQRALSHVTTRYAADKILEKANILGVTGKIADAIIADPGSATNQLASLYTLVKALDPDSAVREGELDLANATRSYWQQFNDYWSRVQEGRVINPEAATKLAQATKQIAGMWQQAAQQKGKIYSAQAGVLGVGPEFQSFLSQANPEAPPEEEWVEVAPGVRKRK